MSEIWPMVLAALVAVGALFAFRQLGLKGG
jgi:hypothetical protein